MNLFSQFLSAGAGWLLSLAGELLKAALPRPAFPNVGGYLETARLGVKPSPGLRAHALLTLSRAAGALAAWLGKLSVRLSRVKDVLFRHARVRGDLRSLARLIDELAEIWET